MSNMTANKILKEFKTFANKFDNLCHICQKVKDHQKHQTQPMRSVTKCKTHLTNVRFVVNVDKMRGTSIRVQNQSKFIVRGHSKHVKVMYHTIN